MTVDEAVNLAWRIISGPGTKLSSHKPDKHEALRIIIRELRRTKFNWITGQNARDVLLSEIEKENTCQT